MIYTNPKNGETVETNLSEFEASHICEEKGSGFAQDLAAKYARKNYVGQSFSPAQLFWMMKLAEEIVNPPVKPHVVLHRDAFENIHGTFHDAALKRPKLRFKTEVGIIRIAISRQGRIFVNCGEALCGEIKNDDKFYYTKNCPDITKTIVKVVAAYPREAAIAWGKQTGCCCFCGRELTTPESVTAGYGPVCADSWGLPWGMVDETVTNVQLEN